MVSAEMFKRVVEDDARRADKLEHDRQEGFINELRSVGAQLGSKLASGLALIMEQVAPQVNHPDVGGTPLVQFFNNLTASIEEYVKVCLVPVNGTQHIELLNVVGISTGDRRNNKQNTIVVTVKLKIRENADSTHGHAASALRDGIWDSLLKHFPESDWKLGYLPPDFTDARLAITLTAK